MFQSAGPPEKTSTSSTTENPSDNNSGSASIRQPTPAFFEKDPFVSSAPIPKSEQRLSATASTFQPFKLRIGSQSGPVGTVRVPNYALIAKTPSVAQSSVEDSIRETLSPTGRLSPITSHRGAFSTDTSVTRALRIIGIYTAPTPAEVDKCLQVSLENMSLQFRPLSARIGELHFLSVFGEIPSFKRSHNSL
jgi:hypothetical protein